MHSYRLRICEIPAELYRCYTMYMTEIKVYDIRNGSEHKNSERICGFLVTHISVPTELHSFFLPLFLYFLSVSVLYKNNFFTFSVVRTSLS